ncbi:MAG: phenylalanine--tRNA ligase subunit alpha [Candidatus Paracaedimonas acanthamoebae]|uniref:Phenylalanine--tRNA ligase alpha subunit n=1 Tax=Candidatus Paracaedimonas acanthamoebae TaxID=244581 RepID=A0A8J7PJJ2_9PROT|nr:phenylalanine--tRNA ligase subunit alpha [Candidatus Paracaedimonas acanthamoebae]
MNELHSIAERFLTQINDASALQELESLRVQALGKQGEISNLMKTLGSLNPEERKERGAQLNTLRDQITMSLEAKKEILEAAQLQSRLEKEKIDVTLPIRPQTLGTIHPISQVMYEMIAIFKNMGFSVAEGPDIEEDFYNFTALNIPLEHPARQDHDTFYLPATAEGTERKVLRTHTSPVQIRSMLKKKGPLRIIAPGRVYRSDYDATHTPTFHQIEGLYVAEGVHMGHLKACLQTFCEEMFNQPHLPLRFRPGYFPFTEPSAEIDIACYRKDGQLIVGPGQDWLEILGCGMIHPKVLENCGIDSTKYQGFAFGMGIERVAMLKYGIPDLRSFYEADLRWLRHYGFSPFEALMEGTSE